MDEAEETRLFELADLILAVGRHIQASKEIAGAAWTPLEAAVMRFIDRHPGATPGEVAEATHLISSNVSRALRNLERGGLVRRDVDDADARKIRLHPTDQARENLRRLHVIWSQLLEGTIDDPDEIEAVTASLRHIEAQLVSRSRHDR